MRGSAGSGDTCQPWPCKGSLQLGKGGPGRNSIKGHSKQIINNGNR